jgi:hypothetical protein
MTVPSSVLPTLTSHGNLIAGAVARVSVGFLLNPFSVLKARFEVRSTWPCGDYPPDDIMFSEQHTFI